MRNNGHAVSHAHASRNIRIGSDECTCMSKVQGPDELPLQWPFEGPEAPEALKVACHKRPALPMLSSPAKVL